LSASISVRDIQTLYTLITAAIHPCAGAQGVLAARLKDSYQSDTENYITIQYQNQNGSYTCKDLAIVAPSSNFGALSFDFNVPEGVTNVTVFHLIKSIGYLRIDNVSVENKSTAGNIFSTGGVTLRLDDGWLSQYKNALPKIKIKRS